MKALYESSVGGKLMAKREFDIAVLGSTGVTGRRVVRYLLAQPEAASLKIGVAGRNLEGVRRVLSEDGFLNKVSVLRADANRPEELSALAQRTKLLLNCIGPYRFTGEAVVSACVEAGTDYLDVSGEPEFIESVELQFSEAATSKGCFVASACGFDSVPADIGTIVTQRKFQPPGVPSSVESFLSFQTRTGSFRANFATWESAVHGFASAEYLRALRKRARASSQAQTADPKPVGPKLKPPGAAVYDERAQAYVVPFPGSDASVVRRTQRALAARGERPVQFNAFFCVRSRLSLLLLAVFGTLLRALAGFRWGRWLLLTFPGIFSWGIFSKAGPSDQHLASTSFKMLFVGRGYTSDSIVARGGEPDKEVRVQVTGPEPGYVATPIFLVQAALVLLAERRAIIETLGSGGVFTVGALLAETAYVRQLQGAGIAIQTISEAAITR